MEDLPHCVVQDCVPFGAAAQKRKRGNGDLGNWEEKGGGSYIRFGARTRDGDGGLLPLHFSSRRDPGLFSRFSPENISNRLEAGLRGKIEEKLAR